MRYWPQCANVVSMDAKTWMRATTPAERRPVLEAAGTTYAYLQQLAGGHRQPGLRLAVALADASAQYTPHAVMTVAALRPDVAELLAISA